MAGVEIVKHFKNSKNEIYAFEADGSQDHLIGADLTPVTDAELSDLRKPTLEQIAAAEKAAALVELTLIDAASVRALREYIASKADAPQILKDKEAAAVIARAKLK
jgi:hypothetical protein